MNNSLYNPFMPDLSMRPRGMVFKGGGGGDTQTVESIPDWYRPFVEKAAGGAMDAYEGGDLSKVVGMNDLQKGAIEGYEDAASKAGGQYDAGLAGQDVMRDQAMGTGAFSPASTEALRTKAIRDAQGAFAPVGAQLASQGQVGGARAGLMAQERDANLAGALAGIDYEAQQADRTSRSAGAGNLLSSAGTMTDMAGKGADYLGTAGSALQDQSQREADATYQGLQRLGGLLSGAPQPSQQAVSGGK